MPGMYYYEDNGTGAPLRLPYDLGNSLSYRSGDLVVLTTAVTGYASLRLAATADATAGYETAAADVVGILGVMDDYITTDATGVATGKPDAVTRAAGVAVNYMVPSRAASLPPDSANNCSRSDIFVVEPRTWIEGRLLETTTVDEDLIGVRVGLSMVVTSGITAFLWSTASAVKIGAIMGVRTTDRLYKVSGGGAKVFVKIDAAYCQYSNGRNYAT